MKRAILLITALSFVSVLGCKTTHTANAKLDQGKYGEAIPLYTASLAENPEDVEARTRLGFAYLKTGRLDEAVVELTQVLTAEPGEPFAILYLGQALLNKDKFDDALAVWNRPRSSQVADVEKEIKRQKSHLLISRNQYIAQKALKEEKALQTARPNDRTIAVFDFYPLSANGTLKAIQKGLAAMLTTDLTKVNALNVIERMQLQALVKEMALGQAGIVDAGTAPRLGRLLRAELLLVGNISGNIEISASVASTSAEAAKGSTSVAVEKTAFYKLPPLIIRDVAKILNIPLSEEEKRQIGIPHTKSFAAFIFYGEAIDALDAGEYKKAKDLFASALKEDPNFGLAQAGFDLVADFSDDDEMIVAPTVMLNEMLHRSGTIGMGMGDD